MSEERLLILKMLAEGKVTPEQADQLLEALESGAVGEEAPGPRPATARSEKEVLSSEQIKTRRQERIEAARERLEAMRGKLEDAHERLEERMGGVQERLEEAQDRLEEMQEELEQLASEGAPDEKIMREDPFRVVAEVMKEVDPGRIVRDVLKEGFPGRIVREAMEGVKEARRSLKHGKSWSFDFGKAFEGFGKDFFGGVSLENTGNLPEHAEEFHAAFTAHPGLIFSLRNPYGDIRVVPGTGQLTVKATKRTWAGSPDEAARMAEHISFSSQESSGEAEMVIERSGPVNNLRVDVEVCVPEGVGIRVETAAGKITLEGVQGSVQAASLSGDIEAKSIQGSTHLESKSGNIDAQGVEGDLQAESLSGDLSVQEAVSGPVSLKSKSGNIRAVEAVRLHAESLSGDVMAERLHGETTLRSVSGDVIAKEINDPVNLHSVSGDIGVECLQSSEVKFSTVSGDVSLGFDVPFSGRLDGNTVSGDVRVSLPAESSFRLELHSQSGDMECGQPLSEAQHGRHHLTGKAGDGEGRIDIKTTSGDIEIGDIGQ